MTFESQLEMVAASLRGFTRQMIDIGMAHQQWSSSTAMNGSLGGLDTEEFQVPALVSKVGGGRG